MKPIYKHYKGNFYQFLEEGKHSETNEEVVIYKDLKTDKIWVRPKELFFGEVNGKKRFELFGYTLKDTINSLTEGDSDYDY